MMGSWLGGHLCSWHQFGAVGHVVVVGATVWAFLTVSAETFRVTQFLAFFASLGCCGLLFWSEDHAVQENFFWGGAFKF